MFPLFPVFQENIFIISFLPYFQVKFSNFSGNIVFICFTFVPIFLAGKTYFQFFPVRKVFKLWNSISNNAGMPMIQVMTVRTTRSFHEMPLVRKSHWAELPVECVGTQCDMLPHYALQIQHQSVPQKQRLTRSERTVKSNHTNKPTFTQSIVDNYCWIARLSFHILGPKLEPLQLHWSVT